MSHTVLTGRTGTCTILVGESIANAERHCPPDRIVIVTDGTVHRLHGHLFPGRRPVIEIGAGEGEKTLATVEGLYRRFLALELDRTTFILAVGGGIVCDVAGFAASTYLRGLAFAFAPTTLLSQVDAAVGGKNGVNLEAYKNLVGTIQQPRFVICDLSVLKTLAGSEIRSGLAEVIKYGAIGDRDLLIYLEEHMTGVLALQNGHAQQIISRSLHLKTTIVSRDETEQGERRTLNFGHTIGHAVERTAMFTHGMAVSVGMAAAARLSVAKGMLAQEDAERLERLLTRFGLPITAPVESNSLLDAIKRDKKRQGDYIHFVLLDGIGKARVLPVTMDELGKVINDLCER